MFDGIVGDTSQDAFEIVTDRLKLCWPFGVVIADLDMHIFEIETLGNAYGTSLDHVARLTPIYRSSLVTPSIPLPQA